MYHVEVRYLNKTSTSTYACREQALGLGRDILAMFDSAEEMWYEKERKTYVVTVLEEVS